MRKKKEKLLAVIGVEFYSSYAGTQYLLESLGMHFDVSCYLFAIRQNRPWYKQLPYVCHVFPFWGTPWVGIRFRFISKIFRIGIFLRMLFARQVLITETNYLREAAWAKKIRGKRMVLTQYCQELILPEEYPNERWPATQKRYGRIPDIVIDVDPWRAKIRQEYFGLKNTPYVLRNTFPISQMPPQAPRGCLWELSGILPPSPDIPVLLHAGGLGREKPFDRIIDAVAALERPIFLLAFCTAPNEKIQFFRDMAAQKLPQAYFHFSPTVPRDLLRASLWEADIGVVDYTYSVEPTVNQKYCAPTKLYEFMAGGLAILGSNNNTLRDVIEGEGIGLCAQGDAPMDLTCALEGILQGRIKEMKQRAKTSFMERYSYEKICAKEMSKIVEEMQFPAKLQ